MNRVNQVDPTQATGKARQLLDGVQGRLGVVPNVFRVLGNAPAALEGYLNLHSALSGGSFNLRLREQLALTIAETNLCGYCLSVHSYLGAKAGLTEQDLLDARRATASSDRTDAILKLARAIVLQRGEVSDATLQAARASGLGDAEIVETVAHVALHLFTNYLNHVARTVVDFPEVKPGVPPASEAACATTTGGTCGCGH